MTAPGVRSRALGLTLTACLLVLADAGVGSRAAPAAPAGDGASGRPRLVDVPQPNLKHMDEATQRALATARTNLDIGITRDERTDEQLAFLYGDMGLLYQAHQVFAAAEACYRNALRLWPDKFRWRYYLAYLYQYTGRLAEAADAYQHALTLRPEHSQSKLRLGQTYLELNRLEQAEAILQAAATSEETRAAALFALGRLALTRRDYARAVEHLSAALQFDPQASRVHFSLAMAYRGLNDTQRAREHLLKRGDVDPTITDPLIEALERRSTGQRALYHQAIGAIHQREYSLAVEIFSEALALDQDNPNARVSLARARYLSGDRDGTRRELAEALRQDPSHTLASFLSGVLAAEAGSTETATAYFLRTLEIDPDHAGAHYYLASLLMAAGDYVQAAQHYGTVVRHSPENLLAQHGEALALIRSNADHPRIRDHLEGALEAHPDNPVFAYLLARLLAASPDAAVRDGKRAQALASRLYEANPLPEHAEVIAMAYADQQQYQYAVAAQQKAVTSASFFRVDLLPRLEGDLERYRQGRPCRVPWPDNGPGVGPPPSDGTRAFRDYPAGSAF